MESTDKDLPGFTQALSEMFNLGNVLAKRILHVMGIGLDLEVFDI